MSFAFNSIDDSQDGVITAAEWTKMKEEPTVRSSMAGLGVWDPTCIQILKTYVHMQLLQTLYNIIYRKQ